MNDAAPTHTGFRRWALGFIAGLVLFLLGNFALWATTTGPLFFPAPNRGDLARVGYFPNLATPRHEIYTLPKRQWVFDDVKPGEVDVVTVGDSISRGRGCGENNYYQDHIATIHGLNTLHLIEMGDISMLDAIIIYRNSGLLRKLGAKHVIVQSAERQAVERFNRELNLVGTKPIDELWNFYQREQPHRTIYSHTNDGMKRDAILEQGDLPTRAAAYARQFCLMHVDELVYSRFRNWVCENFENHPFADDPIVSVGLRTPMEKALNVNMKYVVHQFYYFFDLRAQQTVTQLYETDRPLFAEVDGKLFLSHVGDLRNQVLAERPGWMEKMHDNFNRVARMLREDGITLHVMISPNKLTVYHPYLTDKSVPRSVYFDRMRTFTDREYEFVDTEKVISDLIGRGEKDVYYAGDSHWSSKPLDGIVRSMRFGSAAVARTQDASTKR